MIDMKPKDVTRMSIFELDMSETYPEEEVSPKDGLYRYLYQPGE